MSKRRYSTSKSISNAARWMAYFVAFTLAFAGSGPALAQTKINLETQVFGVLPTANGGTGTLGAGVATWLATPSSANLAAAVTGETGSGALVFGTSPSLTTPDLGTPSAATLTNATGLPVATGISGLGAGVATWLATPSSANLAAAVTGETGSGALVFAASPALTGTVTTQTVNTAGRITATQISSGSTETPLSLVNSGAAAGTGVGIDFAPNSAGVGVRSAQIISRSMAGGNEADLLFNTAPNGASPANAMLLQIDQHAKFFGGVQIGATLTVTTGALGMAKIAASGSAPGAGGAKFEVVCGTNAGTAKLVMYAGTSTTAVTVVDNVGGGVTGC